MSLFTEIEEFIEYCRYEKKLDHKTTKAYSIDLNQFKDFISSHNQKSFFDITQNEIRDYLKSLNKLFMAKTVKRKIATLRSFYSYTERQNDEFHSPLRKLRIQIREPKMLPKTISKTDIKTLFRHLYKLKESTPAETSRYVTILRDLITVELLFISGVRVSELSNLKITDISESFDTLRIMGKGKKERIIPIYTASVSDLLTEYLSYRKPENSYLLQNSRNRQFSSQSIRFMIRKYTDASNISAHITPHMFRHTVATLLLENELDIRYIQHLLGHSSISTTEIYTHVTAQSYKKQISQKHPRKGIFDEG